MTQPWEVAVRVMREYHASEGDVWPGDEAEDVLATARAGRDHRWTAPDTVDRGRDVLRRAAFDVDDLAENHLGIHLEIANLEDLDAMAHAPVYGVAYPESRKIRVCDRALKYEPLYRSTVLHEVGHVLLHRRTACRYIMFTPDRRPQNPQERDANQFMHTALLPKPVLKLAVAYVCHLWGIDIQLPIGSANSARGRWIWRHRLFSPIISDLCVSRQLIAIKLRRMNCFSNQTVQHHKTYALRTRWREPESPTLLAKSLAAILEQYESSVPLDAA